jgi:hypothetical protein
MARMRAFGPASAATEQRIAADIRADIDKPEIRRDPLGEKSALLLVKQAREEQNPAFADIIIRQEPEFRAETLHIHQPPVQ